MLHPEVVKSDQALPVNGSEPQGIWRWMRLRGEWVGIILLATAIALTGCSSPPRVGSEGIDCEMIDNRTIMGLFKQAPEDLTLYLEKEFDTTVKQVSRSITTASGVTQESYFGWSNRTGSYQLSAFGTEPRYVILTFGDKKPALGRVIECLGAPTHYSVRYGSAGDSRPFVVGELFYSNKGVIVWFRVQDWEIEATSNQQNLIRAVTSSTPVDRMQWVEPNHDIETMDWLATLDEWRPDDESRLAFRQQRLDYYRSVRPWPGAIDRMVLTYIAPHLAPAITVESPLQPTATP